MILHDLLEEHNLSEDSDFDYELKGVLKKKGYKFKGRGVDQMAFVEPGTGYILKIFGTRGSTFESGKFTRDQMMFFAWAKFCMKNSNNKFLPKFYGYEPFRFKNRLYLQIRQERLYEAETSGLAIEAIAYELDKRTNLSANAFLELVKTHNIGQSGELQIFIKKLGNTDFQLLFKTIQSLVKISEKRSLWMDLHYQNVMMRKDGTPVIIDPWYVGE